MGQRVKLKGMLGKVKFQFNPTEDSDEGGISWNEIDSPGCDTPIFQVGFGKPRTINFTLYLNQKYDLHTNVKSTLNQLIDYRNAKTTQVFTYGTFCARVVITECKYDVLSRDHNLNPTEANVDLTMCVVKQ